MSKIQLLIMFVIAFAGVQSAFAQQYVVPSQSGQPVYVQGGSAQQGVPLVYTGGTDPCDCVPQSYTPTSSYVPTQQYVPTTQYAVPQQQVLVQPTAGTPVTMGNSMWGTVKAYVPGQNVRNFFRYLTF